MSETNENETPQSPESSEPTQPSNGASSSGNFPRRRRRDSLSGGEGASSSATPDSSPKQEGGGASASSAPDPLLQTIAGSAVSSAPAPVKKKEDKAKLKSVAAKEAAVEVPPGRRAMRILLILAVFGIGWLGLVMNLQKMSRGDQEEVHKQLLALPASAMAVDYAPGNAKSSELEKVILAGQQAVVLKQAAAFRKQFPNNRRLMRTLFKAESVQAVVDIGALLGGLPKPAPTDTAVPLETTLDILRKRITLLNVLKEHLADWDKAILEPEPARAVYQTFGQEMVASRQQLEDWTAALSHLRGAQREIKNDPPAFDRCAERLRAAWGFLKLDAYTRAALNAEHIGRAEMMLRHKVVDKTVRHLKGVVFPEANVSSETATPPATNLAAIRFVLREHYGRLQARVGAWDRLNTAYNSSKRLIEEGKAKEAIAGLQAALDTADATNPLTFDMLKRVRARQKHYVAIVEAWDAAQAAKQDKPLGEQLGRWSVFQRVIQKDDVYYTTAFLNELRELKVKIQTRVAEHYAKLAAAETGYTRITLNMRKPENPRGPFAAQAIVLLAMAKEASVIRDTADLVSEWNLGDETNRQISYAKTVLGDHNDQASRLHNLYMLYQKRGKLTLARECLIRVRLLGNVSSNPWYAEAVKILQGKTPGSAKGQSSVTPAKAVR